MERPGRGILARTAGIGRLSGSSLFLLSFVAFAFSFLIVGTPARAAGDLLRLNTANAPPNATQDHTGIGDRVVTEAFRRLGLGVEIVSLPSERALVNANEGVDDGNFARVEGLSRLYSNLVQVPEEITRFEFVVFARARARQDIDPAPGWEGLRPFNVGIVTGWKILEENVTGTKSLTKVKDENLLFSLLGAGKADVVIYDRRQGETFLRAHGMEGIMRMGQPLADKGMFLYLNKRHAGLVPRLAEAIREMKKDGTYRAILGAVLFAASDR